MSRSIRGLPLLLLASIASAACAKTKLTQVRGPTPPVPAYRRIMVLIPLADGELRRFAEHQFVDHPDAAGTFVPSYRIIVPGRSYTTSSYAALLRERGIDATLRLYLPAYGTTEDGTSVCGGGGDGSGGSDGLCGASAVRLWAIFDLRLIDARTDSVVWSARAETGGGPLAGNKALLKSMARKTIESLVEAGILPTGR